MAAASVVRRRNVTQTNAPTAGNCVSARALRTGPRRRPPGPEADQGRADSVHEPHAGVERRNPSDPDEGTTPRQGQGFLDDRATCLGGVQRFRWHSTQSADADGLVGYDPPVAQVAELVEQGAGPQVRVIGQALRAIRREHLERIQKAPWCADPGLASRQAGPDGLSVLSQMPGDRGDRPTLAT